MPFITRDDVHLHYETYGAGTPVVFLHGLGSGADDWALQVPAFAKRHHVITVDLRAHGRSRHEGALTVEQMAGDVAALLEHLGAAPAHVVGLSLGGCVALAHGIHHSEQVRSLTLVNTFARFQSAGVGGLWRGVRRLWLLQFRPIRELAEFVASELFPKPEQKDLRESAIASLSRNSRETYRAALRAILRFDVRAQLGNIRCPTLVVIGERDRTVPRAAGELLARAIPGARTLVLADSGHASPMDQPEAFNAAVLGFLESSE
ncbi:MAG: alpha/beta fold hydrolase [Anaerolineales bacterium]|nr:alpha/beta fold hydrolase [Anaerolineales bacterium]